MRFPHAMPKTELGGTMPKTAVALFSNPALVEVVVEQIEKLGIPKHEVRTLNEPRRFPVDGVMSFARLEFEVELKHALSEIGLTDTQEEAYLQGLRDGGVLVLASGSDERVDAAAEIMNSQGALGLEKGGDLEPQLPVLELEGALPTRETFQQFGRIRVGSSGAQLFFW
jgi:hypothetical protein